MIRIKTLLLLVPLFVVYAIWRAYMRPCRLSRRAVAAWVVVLLACYSKFFVYCRLGCNAIPVAVPEWLTWVWNWACAGAFFMLPVAVVALPLRRLRHHALAVPAAAWGLAALGVWNNVKPPAVREMELDFPNLPAALDGYRIAHVADIHASSEARRWRTEAIVRLVNAARPDLICLVGDLMDGVPKTHLSFIEPLAGLSAPDGVYATTGNHEFFYDFEEWLPHYERMGIRFLRNECVFPRYGLALGGVDDDKIEDRYPWMEDLYPDVHMAFASATNGEFRILMEHKPRSARDNFAAHGVNLQLSGHTHGGLMPGFDLLVQAINWGYLRGVYAFPGGGKMYVTTGTGEWTGIPVRFFDESEIVIITLRRR